jgi:hypothetical protein
VGHFGADLAEGATQAMTHGALLQLFSAAADQVQYGAEHYRLPSAEVSTIINRLIASYRQEGLVMPYTMNDFRKEVALEVLDELSPEERLRGLPPEERLRGLSAKQIEDYLARLRKKASNVRAKKRHPKL